MLGLKYVPGSVPGKRNKTKAPQLPSSKKEYEENRIPRKLNPKWQQGRPWLVFDQSQDTMTCAVCIEFYKSANNTALSAGGNTFITGCSNKRVSTVVDHEKCKMHLTATKVLSARRESGDQIMNSCAGKTLNLLKQSERNRLSVLFRNAHAIVVNNRPFRDYVWLCQLNKQKGIDVGDTYLNDKAAFSFVEAIASADNLKTKEMTLEASFYSIMLDGSTDIAGDEQEAVYLRLSIEGKIRDRFLGIGTPESTTAVDLEQFLLTMLSTNGIEKDKLIGFGSDGASNMVGKKGGLATLLRRDVNSEMINVHCFAHRLELSFRDVLKKYKIYDKLMNLLVGLHYFYTKQHKNKKGLVTTFQTLHLNGLLPPKVTGTRWLPHLARGITALFRSYTAYNAHLCSLSHTNPKAEGLAKILLGKDLVCFALFLKELLVPLMQLSLRLQKTDSNIADGKLWVESTIELLKHLKEFGESDEDGELQQLISTGKFQDIDLKGRTPEMNYKVKIIDELSDAMNQRFNMSTPEMDVIKATKLLHLKNWSSDSTTPVKEFGVSEVKVVCSQFERSLKKAKENFDMETALNELKMLKVFLQKKFGDKLKSLSWFDIYNDLREDFPHMLLIVDILNSIPATSVRCETTFSQMKLIKTCRRTKLRGSTLNALLLVKLESPSISEYDPATSIDCWMASSLKKRVVNYRRKKVSVDPTPTEQTSNEAELLDIKLQKGWIES